MIKKKKIITLLATSAIAVGILAACGTTEKAAPEKEAVETAEPKATEVSPVQEDIFAKEPIEIKLDTKDYAYQPNQITVEKGVPFTLTLTNSDTVLHDLQIDSEDFYKQVSMEKKEKPDIPGVHLHGEAGETDSKVFIASKEGTYEMYCMVPGHKEKGMIATLTVQ